MTNNDTAKHDALVEDVRAKFGDAVVEVDRTFDDLAIVVSKASLHDVLAHLRAKHGFDMLLDIAGIDCMDVEGARERFELEYILLVTASCLRCRVRTRLPETELNVPTATDLWQSANWAEREAYEMFGFNFVGHPCLKRLLTHHEFKGHPLRKDYPLMGGQWCTSTSVLDDELNERQGGAPK